MAAAPCCPGMPADRIAPTRVDSSMSATSSGPPWKRTTTRGLVVAFATACRGRMEGHNDQGLSGGRGYILWR